MKSNWPPLIDPSAPTPTWAQAAQAAIREFCGWHVAPVITETLRVDGNGERKIHLPTMRLVDVKAVRLSGRDIPVGDVEWSEAGMLRLPERVPERFGVLSVTVEHGFDETTHIAALVRNISERAEATPAGVTRKQIGDVSLSYGDSQNGGLRLFAGEKEQLSPYRLWMVP